MSSHSGICMTTLHMKCVLVQVNVLRNEINPNEEIKLTCMYIAFCSRKNLDYTPSNLMDIGKNMILRKV